MLADLAPYGLLTIGIVCLLWPLGMLSLPAPLILVMELVAGVGIYWIVLRLAGSKVLAESQNYLLGRFRKK